MLPEQLTLAKVPRPRGSTAVRRPQGLPLHSNLNTAVSSPTPPSFLIKNVQSHSTGLHCGCTLVQDPSQEASRASSIESNASADCKQPRSPSSGPPELMQQLGPKQLRQDKRLVEPASEGAEDSEYTESEEDESTSANPDDMERAGSNSNVVTGKSYKAITQHSIANDTIVFLPELRSAVCHICGVSVKPSYLISHFKKMSHSHIFSKANVIGEMKRPGIPAGGTGGR